MITIELKLGTCNIHRVYTRIRDLFRSGLYTRYIIHSN